mmetsp:Transcript_22162/g.58761  ORF Transcript_22162/g.58761 Transcript_22162/m.58761 type:complete len:250 (+) Transcript_22162:1559-2308(+)
MLLHDRQDMLLVLLQCLVHSRRHHNTALLPLEHVSHFIDATAHALQVVGTHLLELAAHLSHSSGMLFMVCLDAPEHCKVTFLKTLLDSCKLVIDEAVQVHVQVLGFGETWRRGYVRKARGALSKLQIVAEVHSALPAISATSTCAQTRLWKPRFLVRRNGVVVYRVTVSNRKTEGNVEKCFCLIFFLIIILIFLFERVQVRCMRLSQDHVPSAFQGDIGGTCERSKRGAGKMPRLQRSPTQQSSLIHST